MLREENEKLRSETREMVRKLEVSEASQEILRSQVSCLSEANSIYQDDAKSLRAELVEIRGKYDRVLADLESEKSSLKVHISDLEVGFEQFRSWIERGS